MTQNRQSRIEALFVSYRDSLPPLMLEFETTWQCLVSEWDESLARDFERKVHGLAGSAATFELAQIGDAARELEYQLKSLLENHSDTTRLADAEKRLLQLKDVVKQNLS